MLLVPAPRWPKFREGMYPLINCRIPAAPYAILQVRIPPVILQDSPPLH